MSEIVMFFLFIKLGASHALAKKKKAIHTQTRFSFIYQYSFEGLFSKCLVMKVYTEWVY